MQFDLIAPPEKTEVLLFNLPDVEAARMFKVIDDSEHEVLMHVVVMNDLVWHTLRNYRKRHEQIEEIIMNTLGPDHEFDGGSDRYKVVGYVVHFVNLPRFMKDRFTPPMAKWEYASLYLQIGYSDAGKSAGYDPAAAIGYGMTVYDMAVSQGHLLGKDPLWQKPIAVSACQAQAIRSSIGDAYERGVTIWNEDLIEHRNENLLRIRGAISGLPQERIEKLLSKDSPKYFLDRWEHEFWACEYDDMIQRLNKQESR